MSRDPIEERGGINIYSHTTNDPLNAFDPDGRTIFAGGAVLIVAGGSLLIEIGVRLACVLTFERCEEAWIRTPVSILLHFSAVFNAAGMSACGGAYTVRTRLWKDAMGDCHSEYGVFCLWTSKVQVCQESESRRKEQILEEVGLL